MLLIPYIDTNLDLFLDAFSFNSNEIDSVARLIEKCEIELKNTNLRKDRHGRYGLRFIVSLFDRPKLENRLNIRFTGTGKNTLTQLADEGAGSSYRCKRVDSPPNNCQTIYAEDDDDAIVKCALVANENNWLGGVPTPGQC